MRGFAVLIMVLNHFGYPLLSAEEQLTPFFSGLLFLSSYAPVLFFFITGVGYGLAYSPESKKEFRASVWFKVGVLVLADFFMRGAEFDNWGWDFLAFIGFSMLILEALKSLKYPMVVGVIVIFSALLVRYGVAPIYKSLVVEADRNIFVLYGLGVEKIPNVSYWFTPWIIYPLSGFLVGGYLSGKKALIDRSALKIGAALTVGAIFSVVAVIALKQLGQEFFRWGTVSLAFFVSGYSALLVAVTIAHWMSFSSLRGIFERLFVLKGVSSLAAVPIHYALLVLFKQSFELPVGGQFYFLVMVLVLPLTVVLSRGTNILGVRLAPLIQTLAFKVGTLVYLTLVILIIATGAMDELVNYCLAFIAQILLCIVLKLNTVRFKPSPKN